MALLDLSLAKRLGDLSLRVDLALEAGVTAIVGPSGSGKTSLLRCVAGLERPETGRIAFAGETWYASDQGVNVPVQGRRVGFVFSDYALFPHLTVRRNVAFGARNPAHVEESLRRLSLSALSDRYPRHLSAGEQQRVAIARAIAAEPRLLLMDEPFSSLDPHLKSRVYAEFNALTAELGLPVLLVTHDLAEACLLANRVVVLAEGAVLQAGSPRDILHRPVSPEVAYLAGNPNVFPGAVAPGCRLAWGEVELDVATPQPLAGSSVTWCLRSEQVELAPGPGANVVEGIVASLGVTGHGYRLTATVPGCGPLQAILPLAAVEGDRLRVGETVSLRLPPEAIWLMGERAAGLADLRL